MREKDENNEGSKRKEKSTKVIKVKKKFKMTRNLPLHQCRGRPMLHTKLAVCRPVCKAFALSTFLRRRGSGGGGRRRVNMRERRIRERGKGSEKQREESRGG